MRRAVITLLVIAALGAVGSLAPSRLYAEPVAPVQLPAATSEDPALAEVMRSAREQILALVQEDAEKAQASSNQPGSGADDADAADALVNELPPPSMTSAAPAAAQAPSASSKELAWLEGLKLPDIPVRWDDRLVRTLEYYKNDARGRAQVRSLLARQGRYGDMIRQKLRAQGLPEDLSYVAMVESAYEPTAHSEVGAVGIWQFMAAPATDYSLEMSRYVDQRMNPEQSTDAATHYFKDLYSNLGSWPLSIAAFNMGYGALLRAMQKYNTNDFSVLAGLEAGLPYETIQYVTKIVACAIIGHNPDRFGVNDVTPDAAVQTAEISVPGGTSLSRVAKTAGIDATALALLNPELKKSRLPPDVKSWTLRIPADRIAHFKEKWPLQKPELAAHRTHTLRMGERVSDVAEMYGTTSAKLLALNDMEDSSGARPGKTLLVPDVDPATPEKTERPNVGIPGDVFVYVDRKRVFYRAAEGDRLTEIASFFKVTSDELRMWNHIEGDAKLHRGMYLQLFVPADSDLSQAIVLTPNEVRTLVVGSDEFFAFHETQQSRVRVRYRVKAGDTLRTIAERFDLSVGSIARINQFSRDKQLDPNSEIIVYAPQDPSNRNASD